MDGGLTGLAAKIAMSYKEKKGGGGGGPGGGDPGGPQGGGGGGGLFSGLFGGASCGPPYTESMDHEFEYGSGTGPGGVDLTGYCAKCGVQQSYHGGGTPGSEDPPGYEEPAGYEQPRGY
jgi:hypothetical protein